MKRILKIILGNMILAFSIATLLLENGIISGGVSGVGLTMQHFFGISVSTSVMLINVVLFVFGYFEFGKEYALTTLLSSLIFPIFLNLFSSMHILSDTIDDMLLISVCAGILNGIGIGLVLKEGSSTGGLVIFTQIMHKRFHIPLELMVNITDTAVLILQIFYNPAESVIYGIVVVMITSIVMKKVLMSGKSLVQIIIISDRYNEIKEVITKELDCGVTLLEGRNGLRDLKTNVLLSISTYQKLPVIQKRIMEIDENAFVAVSSVDEVSDHSHHLA